MNYNNINKFNINQKNFKNNIPNFYNIIHKILYKFINDK